MVEIVSREKVVSRDGDFNGVTIGGSYPCKMEGCRGTRLSVRWDDGKVSFPCTKGMTYHDNTWQIL